MNDALEVWLDAEFAGPPVQIGTLFCDREQIRFQYLDSWLKHPLRFTIDPELQLDSAPFFPKVDAGNFGIFLDSSPDRWGQTLMKRREVLEAKDENRKPRTLYAWDYLLGVQDVTRQGALRFRRKDTQAFLSSHKLAAPPVTDLHELQSVAYEITNKRIEDLDALRRWLSVLVAPGASLGGARPKANYTAANNSLWIAKFPARDDERDIGAWEGVIHELAQSAGVAVPTARTLRVAGDYHTFCVQRFDRQNGRRVFYASAMSVLQKQNSEGTSYIELAEFIQNHGSKNFIKTDLEQLYRRVLFNVAVSNRDDHLRNHGFILNHDGWMLAPAFDVNANIDKAEHVLNLDEHDNRPSFDSVRATAPWYGLNQHQAASIFDEVVGAVRKWQSVAEKYRLSQTERLVMSSAFALV